MSPPTRAYDHRVEITVSDRLKHRLPVHPSCLWSHTHGIPGEEEGCKTVGGRPVENYPDLWSCMQESPCDVTGAFVHTINIKWGGWLLGNDRNG